MTAKPNYWTRQEEEKIMNQFLANEFLEIDGRSKFAIELRLGKLLKTINIDKLDPMQKALAKVYIQKLDDLNEKQFNGQMSILQRLERLEKKVFN